MCEKNNQNNKNKIIEYSASDIEAAIEEVRSSSISCKECVLHCLESVVNISSLLDEKRMTIERLLRALYDKKSERIATKDNVAAKDSSGEEISDKGSNHSNEDVNKKKSSADDRKTATNQDKKKGHGRNSLLAYTGAEVVDVKHKTLVNGDPCPTGCSGKVYKHDPGVYVRVTGGSLLSATVYRTQKYRCNACLEIFEATLEPSIKKENKYDSKSIAAMAHAKFELGIPYYRLEQYQRQLGIPLPSSVQSDQMEVLANSCFKIFFQLEYFAANSPALAFDDTNVPVLEYEKENKKFKEDTSYKKGYYTSVLAAKLNGEYTKKDMAVVLFYLDRKNAGQNFAKLMEKREPSLPPPQAMSDAYPAYAKYKEDTVDLRCLTHARRKFFLIKDRYPIECKFVLDKIRSIYDIDDITKQKVMNNEERLQYHKHHSTPILNELMDYTNQQLEDSEPNGELVDAISYLQDNWNYITKFVRIPGAMLDNNWVEAIVKDIIKIRKNSLFFKTEISSKIATIILSIIETCKICSVNSFHYLHSVLENQDFIKNNPQEFLPWNYQDALQKISIS